MVSEKEGGRSSEALEKQYGTNISSTNIIYARREKIQEETARFDQETALRQMYPKKDTELLELMTRYMKALIPITLELMHVKSNKIRKKRLDSTKASAKYKANLEGFKVIKKYTSIFLKRNRRKRNWLNGEVWSVDHSNI